MSIVAHLPALPQHAGPVLFGPLVDKDGDGAAICEAPHRPSGIRFWYITMDPANPFHALGWQSTDGVPDDIFIAWARHERARAEKAEKIAAAERRHKDAIRHCASFRHLSPDVRVRADADAECAAAYDALRALGVTP